MKRFLPAILVSLGLGVASLAADFWETKKFPDWSEKEVQKMLKDSPWARTVELRLDFMGGGRMGGRPGSPTPGGPPGGGMPGPEGGGPTPGGFDLPQMAPAVPIVVRWQTALPVRQALAKARFGDEVMNNPEAAGVLSSQPDRYVVAVEGLPPQALRTDLPEVQSNAFLRIKKQPDIGAIDIKGSRAGNLINIYLFFPRGQESAHVITTEDKEVEFVLRLEQIVIKRKFKLKDMVYEGKLEI